MQVFWIIYFFMLGATFASFYNVVGIRCVDHISLTRRSMCPKCNNKLRFIDIVPIFGYLINRGHCHFCKEKIHIKYFLIEVFGGALFVISFLEKGFSLDFVFYLVLMSLIMIMVVSYYEHKVILNKVVYGFIPVLILFSILTDVFLDGMQGMAICLACAFLFSISDKKISKYILYTASFGIVLGFSATVLFLLITLLAMVILKIVNKPWMYVYVVSMTAILSLFTEPYVHELILKIMG